MDNTIPNNLSNQDKLFVIVRNTENIIYQDFAYGISSFNDYGKFSILPHHTNFISIIKEKLIIHKTFNDNLEMDIASGILQNRENKVEIYLGIESI